MKRKTQLLLPLPDGSILVCSVWGGTWASLTAEFSHKGQHETQRRLGPGESDFRLLHMYCECELIRYSSHTRLYTADIPYTYRTLSCLTATGLRYVKLICANFWAKISEDKHPRVNLEFNTSQNRHVLISSSVSILYQLLGINSCLRFKQDLLATHLAWLFMMSKYRLKRGWLCLYTCNWKYGIQIMKNI